MSQTVNVCSPLDSAEIESNLRLFEMLIEFLLSFCFTRNQIDPISMRGIGSNGTVSVCCQNDAIAHIIHYAKIHNYVSQLQAKNSMPKFVVHFDSR